MTCPGGQDDDVTGRKVNNLPLFSAEPNAGLAFSDAKHLVRPRVVVDKIIDAIAFPGFSRLQPRNAKVVAWLT